MLSKEDTELLCRVGPGTPMGELLRQYWIPALLSQELPERDGPPMRIRLLSENLIAFRDTSGQVGLLADNCSHRGASLFFGRNEENGLRCVYHGWKYDVNGRCVDMPNEPPESNFKEKIRHTAYSCKERNGVIWTYMGPRKEPPPLPDIEWTMLPEGHCYPWKAVRDCNWVQALEGDIDTTHLDFLHAFLDEQGESTSVMKRRTRGFGGLPRSNAAGYTQQSFDHPVHLEIVPTDYGVVYGSRRVSDADTYYWRITQFLFPFHCLIPGFPSFNNHVWVPIDDEHTMLWSAFCDPFEPLTEERARLFNAGGPDREYLPATTDWLGAWRTKGNASNDFLLNRDVQRTKDFSGLPGFLMEDTAATVSMGPIMDRTREHLGASDAMIIQVRRRLIAAAKALRDQGVVPPGVDNPEVFAVRPGEITVPKDTNWITASREMLTASTKQPKLS